MTLRIYSCTPAQARSLADFCLNWNCTTLKLFNYDQQLHQAARHALESWPQGGTKVSPERACSPERLNTVAQLILIFLERQERERYPPILHIDSGRLLTIHNFRLSVTEGIIEIGFANIYHAEMLNALGLVCHVEVVSLDPIHLTETKRFEPVTNELCQLRWPQEVQPSADGFDFERWPHPKGEFDRYHRPRPTDALIHKWWTPQHDGLLLGAIEQLGWRWQPPLNEIRNITPPERIAALETGGDSDSAMRTVSYFCKRRALQLDECVTALPELKWLTCRICGQYFHQELAASMGLIKFAVVCSVCHREADPKHEHEWTRAEILDHIRALFAAEGGRFDLPQSILETFSADQYVTLVHLWRFQPPRQLVRDVFGSFFAARIESGVIPDAWVRLSRGTRCLARDGHTCLSLGEKTICDWLFDNGVPHRREVPYGNGCNYLADWEIEGQLVEYLGLTGDDRYDSKTQKKIEFADKHGLRLIAIYPQDLDSLGDVFDKFGIARPLQQGE